MIDVLDLGRVDAGALDRAARSPTAPERRRGERARSAPPRRPNGRAGGREDDGFTEIHNRATVVAGHADPPTPALRTPSGVQTRSMRSSSTAQSRTRTGS